MDYSKLATPATAVADFCLIPVSERRYGSDAASIKYDTIGTPTASVSNEVAAVQRLMKASGLSYSMHSAGTTVEGSWDAVMRLIGQAHTLVHQNGIVRIQSDIRVGTRTDKTQHFADKVSKVEAILAADGGAKVGSKVGKESATAESIDAEGNSGKDDTPKFPAQAVKQPQKGTWASILK